MASASSTTIIAVIIAAAASAGATWYFTARPSGGPASAAAASGPPGGAPGKASGPPPMPVEVAPVAAVTLPQAINSVGSLRSDESVVIRSEVSGRIAEIRFQEGQRVAKGQTLIQLDSSIAAAELAQARANLDLSRSKHARAIELTQKGFISQQAREEAENNFRLALASLQLAEARLAKLDIRAPFAGTIGLRQVAPGDYVKDGQDMVNLEGTDLLKADFRVPEIHTAQVRPEQSLQISLDAIPGKVFEAQVYAINPLVDEGGRSLVIRARVANREGQLRPGMFARVRLFLDATHESLVIPEQALVPQGDDHYVYKVVENQARRTKVSIGQRRDGKVEIQQGLAKGDVVVTAGQIRLRDGAPVEVAQAGPAPVPEAGKPEAKPAPAGGRS